jgi:hypothetical protein
VAGWISKIMGGGGNALIGGGTDASYSVKELYALSVAVDKFVTADLRATFTKILTDVAERSHGIKDKQWKLLFDSCIVTDVPNGLISLVVDAIIYKKDLFLVYKKGENVLRRATPLEERDIKDKSKTGDLSAGVWVSFKNYDKVDILRTYTEIEFCVMQSLYKSVNLARAIQIKIKEMRSSVSLEDSSVAIAQARGIGEALREGDEVLIDEGDKIETSKIDIEPAKQTIMFLDGKRSFHLSLPQAYVNGTMTVGIGSTGEADAKAIDRGLKQYFLSIFQPIVEAVFDVDLTFRSEDTNQIRTAVEVHKSIELTTDELLSRETKQEIVAQLYDVDPGKEKKRIDSEAKDREETEIVPLTEEVEVEE